MSGLDLSSVRRRFPALSREQDGRPVVFADAPGGTQVPETVIEAMVAYLRSSNANTNGAFPTSRETDELIDAAHHAAADLLNADPDEVLFGPNATTLLLALSRSVGRDLSPGDEVVVTRFDHDANVRPWVLAAEDAGATVRWADLREDDVTLPVEAFDGVLGPRTRVVAFSLASNAVGSIAPAEGIVALVRDRSPGAIVCVDAVHLAQHRRIDVRAIGADLAVCSAYKVFGPHLGIAFGRRDLLGALHPYKLRASPEELPFRFETGTQNHEGYAGFVAAVEYLAGRGAGLGAGPGRRERIAAAFDDAIVPHEADLSRRFLEGLSTVPAARLSGIADPARVGERTPTFAIRVGDRHPAETAKALAERGIFGWDGNYYALELMERLGLEPTGGAVRIGFCHYHSADEVDRVLDELEALA